MRALVLPVGDAYYAVPLAGAREVIPAPQVTPLPLAPPAVRGVFSLRGDIVPLLDTGALLGMGALEAIPFAAVVDAADGSAALGLTGAPTSARLSERVGATETPGTAGAYDADGKPVVLLDVPALLAAALGVGLP
jgi:purine-binding chemotaxis protein CheW